MSTISRVWPTALKPGCVTNFDMLFLVMGFISLLDEIQFMLISSRHICIRSMIHWKLCSKVESGFHILCFPQGNQLLFKVAHRWTHCDSPWRGWRRWMQCPPFPRVSLPPLGCTSGRGQLNRRCLLARDTLEFTARPEPKGVHQNRWLSAALVVS